MIIFQSILVVTFLCRSHWLMNVIDSISFFTQSKYLIFNESINYSECASTSQTQQSSLKSHYFQSQIRSMGFKGNQWTFQWQINDKFIINKILLMASPNSNQMESPSTTVKLDCSTSPLSQSGSLSLRLDFTSPSKSPTKSHASSLGIMTSSPPSSTVSATPAMDQDKDAIKKDTNVIMKGKDAIGHDKCGIKVIGIIEKKKKIKNLGNEKAPQKIQQAAQEHMSGGKKAINGMDCD
eukprot:506878_1